MSKEKEIKVQKPRKKNASQILKELDLMSDSKPVTKYSKSIATKILLLIRQGVFFIDAFYAFGIDETKAMAWSQEHPEFTRDVHKYRYQALVDVQREIWALAKTGDLEAAMVFLKAADPERWNIRAKEIEKETGEGKVEKILFVDRILESKNGDNGNNGNNGNKK